ncbi:uncharacterized protein Dwil_GK28074 [Drosophila willistoni]|uniref:Uncharacterized protein n=1 Tax=Drosophila willistoni TaxID=7260 RepID=A0A0Q9X688_DROWI|nr:uncharacterized protein Dwil_GK28074 [Drosophila willistoni]
MDLLKNIKNKEILTEVLHLSVDYLIGNINDQQALRLSHKYGFQNSNDFLLATKSISQYYSICCLDRCDTESWIIGSRLRPELCRILSVIVFLVVP